MSEYLGWPRTACNTNRCSFAKSNKVAESCRNIWAGHAVLVKLTDAPSQRLASRDFTRSTTFDIQEPSHRVLLLKNYGLPSPKCKESELQLTLNKSEGGAVAHVERPLVTYSLRSKTFLAPRK
ncbi:hypothetical protein RRG08_066079 [Elysia crispata]|uniref:Uncharacterized protein n=1 Tax=Elysia crispata TaxID=231223 RepID=A0AAE1CXL6_9GAST|nr:hypothetical protein RRG08_066079 [Elysia crispata]